MMEQGWTCAEMTAILHNMARNSSDLGGRHIAQLPVPPSPLEFLRLVRASSPALIQGDIS